MVLSKDDLRRLCDSAENAATKAADLIQTFASGDNVASLDVQHKTGGSSLASQVVTDADYASDKLIRECLEESCREFDLAMLTEEGEDDKARFTKNYFWCVDPLDGTLAFVEGREGYSVSIALVSRSGKAVIGVVCNPVDGTLYSAIAGQGLCRNRQPWRPLDVNSKDNSQNKSQENVPFSLACDGSFIEAENYPKIYRALEVLASQRGYSGIRVLDHAGAVLNACRVLEHGPGGYIKLPKPCAGGGSVWDFAASAVLFNEASAFAGDVFGEALELNPFGSLFMNQRGVLYASDTALARDLQVLVSSFV